MAAGDINVTNASYTYTRNPSDATKGTMTLSLPTGNVSVSVSAIPNKYNVTYKAGISATGSDVNETAMYDSQYTFRSNEDNHFRRTGYFLKGWTLDQASSTNYDYDADEVITWKFLTDKNLYGFWSKNTYTIRPGTIPLGTSLTPTYRTARYMESTGSFTYAPLNSYVSGGHTYTVYVQGNTNKILEYDSEAYYLDPGSSTGWYTQELDGEVYLVYAKATAYGQKTLTLRNRIDASVYRIYYYDFIPSTGYLTSRYNYCTLPASVTFNRTFTATNVSGNDYIDVSTSTCLSADMLITMADGTSKRISEVQPNDRVLSYNPYTQTECTATVIYCQPTNESNIYYSIDCEDDQILVYGDHAMWDKNNKCPVDYKKMIEKIDTFEGIDINHKAVKFDDIHEVESTEPVVFYSLIVSNGLYYVNGILSAHRAHQKERVLGHLVENLDDRVIDVFKQDNADYTKVLTYKTSKEYLDLFAWYDEQRTYYNKIIMDEFAKLGVDIKELSPLDKNKKHLFFIAIKEQYPKYAGRSKILDDNYAIRYEIDEKWKAGLRELSGVYNYNNYSAELFEKCFKRDLEIEDLVRQEDFDF